MLAGELREAKELEIKVEKVFHHVYSEIRIRVSHSHLVFAPDE